MADVFLSYSRANKAQAGAVAAALDASGRSTWWDRALASGEDYSQTIEREIADAGCVVVAWSSTARDSLWVRAEANEALDQDKLVQINLDGAKLPLPFTMLHWLDFSAWPGTRDHMPWPMLATRIGAQLGGGGEEAVAGRRPDPGGIAIVAGPEPTLQGLGKIAALGWAALATALLLVVSVLMVARGMISAAAFGAVSIAAVTLSAVLLLACAYLMLRIGKASRR